MNSDLLVNRIKTNYKQGSRYVIAISGPPGSGKTTIATQIAEKLHNSQIRACQVSMDGFHYTRAELDQMDDPVAAHKFRGAPFTFDLPRIKEFASKLHTRTEVVCPTFDHAKKDPEVNGTVISPEIDVIIFEGNYLLLDVDGWQDLAKYWDDRWLLSVPEPVLRQRLAQRHLKAGLVNTIEDGYARADFNDVPNGQYLMAHCSYDLKVEGLE